jgi:phosphatidylinositol-3,4,5-trisphosphate 3-phosphatase and dual-specificity protein phosphatase PTEN
LACAYILLSWANTTSPRSLGATDDDEIAWALVRPNLTIEIVSDAAEHGESPSFHGERDVICSDKDSTDCITKTAIAERMIELQKVFDLHSSRRMKPPGSSSSNINPGISIPSQRRWLYYWSRILHKEAPPSFWAPLMPSGSEQHSSTVTLTQIYLRMMATSKLRSLLAKPLDFVSDVDNESRETRRSPVWISLARYEDQCVDTLEEREKRSRNETGGPSLSEWNKAMFDNWKWDKEKMVKKFGKLKAVGKEEKPGVR